MIRKSSCEALCISSKCNVVSGFHLNALVRQQDMLFGFLVATGNDDSRL